MPPTALATWMNELSGDKLPIGDLPRACWPRDARSWYDEDLPGTNNDDDGGTAVGEGRVKTASGPEVARSCLERDRELAGNR
ncbi:hypothetical protein M378DRAFT_163097, partial [Amanita muscaria Koide BX008]